MKTKSKEEQAYLAALKQIIPPLAELSDAVHAAALETSDEHRELDRVLALGEVVDSASMLCAPAVRVLADLSAELLHLTHRDHDAVDEVPSPDSPPTEH